MDWWTFRRFRSSTAIVRQQAAIDFGVARDVKAVPGLIALLNDPDQSVRGSAAGALGRIADRRASLPLVAVAGGRDQDTARSALISLGEIKDPETIAPIARLFATASPELAPDCLKTLEQIDPAWKTSKTLASIVPDLILAMANATERVARLLAYVNDPRSIEALVKAQASHSSGVRMWAAHALRAAKDPRGLHPLVALASIGSAFTPAISLRSPTEPGAAEKLAEILTVSQIRILEEIGDAETVPSLIENYRRWQRGDGPEISYDRNPSAPREDNLIGSAPMEALEKILQRSVAAIPESDLRELLKLEDTHWNVRVDFGTSGADESTVDVHCGAVREQAGNELKRRGLPLQVP